MAANKKKRDTCRKFDFEFSDDTLAALAALSPRRIDFVLAYEVPGTQSYHHAERSALRAGYAPKAAATQGRKQLQNTAVKVACLCVHADLKRVEASVSLVDAAWMHRHLSALAQASVLDFGTVDVKGQYAIDLRKVEDKPELARAIESIKTTENRDGARTTEIRLMPRRALLDMLGKHARVDAWVHPQADESADADNLKGEDDIKAARERARGATGLRLVAGEKK